MTWALHKLWMIFRAVQGEQTAKSAKCQLQDQEPISCLGNKAGHLQRFLRANATAVELVQSCDKFHRVMKLLPPFQLRTHSTEILINVLMAMAGGQTSKFEAADAVAPDQDPHQSAHHIVFNFT